MEKNCIRKKLGVSVMFFLCVMLFYGLNSNCDSTDQKAFHFPQTKLFNFIFFLLFLSLSLSLSLPHPLFHSLFLFLTHTFWKEEKYFSLFFLFFAHSTIWCDLVRTCEHLQFHEPTQCPFLPKFCPLGLFYKNAPSRNKYLLLKFGRI